MPSHFDPDRLRACQRAFDHAWDQIRLQCSREDHEWMRDRVARAVIALAQAGHTDPEIIAVLAVLKGRSLLKRASV